MRKKSSNPILKETLTKLRKIAETSNDMFWCSIIETVSSPNSRRPVVNVGKISKYTKEHDLVLVPGKILGDGLIDHPVVVGSLSTSKNAGEKIRAAGGSVLSLVEFAEKYRDGSKVMVIGG